MSVRSLTSLRKEAKTRGIAVVTKQTLDRYGLSEREWLAMLDDQSWRCPVCDKEPTRFVTDHEHVRGWKAMPPERRKLYVRGLTCWTCNRYLLARGVSVQVAEGVARYLSAYAARRPE